jgi:fibronectin type 3 domain-containing protein
VTVSFRAVDSSGNVSTGTARLTVVKGAAPFQPPVDRIPPGNITHVGFEVSDRSVTLSWKFSGDRDADHVVVYRSLPDGRGAAAIASTKVTQFTDRGLKNGRTYRYVIVEYDRAGNRSAGVAVIAVPRAPSLVRPPLGATVHGAPVLQWIQASSATYYNVQLFRDGQKVFTSWPTQNRLALPHSWVIADIKVELRPGHYAWFVWPGYGRLADKRYGNLLGRSTFVVS